jgi:hypothetical protein
MGFFVRVQNYPRGETQSLRVFERLTLTANRGQIALTSLQFQASNESLFRKAQRMSQQIRCTCGSFQARLTAWPQATPGRLKCYCDDCQMYLMHLGRTDLLDAAGGTEVIPTYPVTLELVSGVEHLTCTRLSAQGMFRFSTTCCNSPVANTAPGRPWVGVLRNMYTQDDAQLPERVLGPLRSSIMGKFATGPVPPGTPNTMSFQAARSVMPFMAKGFFGRKITPSPFFGEDGKTPIVQPTVLTVQERERLMQDWSKRRASSLEASRSS